MPLIHTDLGPFLGGRGQGHPIVELESLIYFLSQENFWIALRYDAIRVHHLNDVTIPLECQDVLAIVKLLRLFFQVVVAR